MLLDSTQNKEKILKEFLKIAEFDGWNENSLEKAFEKSDIDKKFITLIFENGILDLADFYIEFYNKKLEQKIAKISDFNQLRIRDKITQALYCRFELEKNNQLAMQRLVNFYANPKNLVDCNVGVRPSIYGLKTCYKVADCIWSAINDQSTDFNFYTKRLTLAKIIFRSIAIFVKDDSKNLQKTKSFIDLEIAKVMKFEKFKAGAKKAVNHIFINEDGSIKTPQQFIKNLPFIRLNKFK